MDGGTESERGEEEKGEEKRGEEKRGEERRGEERGEERRGALQIEAQCSGVAAASIPEHARMYHTCGARVNEASCAISVSKPNAFGASGLPPVADTATIGGDLNFVPEKTYAPGLIGSRKGAMSGDTTYQKSPTFWRPRRVFSNRSSRWSSGN
jgi:hypothetical protein